MTKMNKCEYCNDNKLIYDGMVFSRKSEDGYSGIDILVEDNKLCVTASADTYEPNYLEAEVEINYCPMCGKKLIVEGVEKDEL